MSVPKTDFIFHTSLYLLNKPRKPYSWNWYLTHNINSFDFIYYTAYDECIGQFETTIKLFDLISLFNQIQKTLKLEIENIFNRKNLYKCVIRKSTQLLKIVVFRKIFRIQRKKTHEVIYTSSECWRCHRVNPDHICRQIYQNFTQDVL